MTGFLSRGCVFSFILSFHVMLLQQLSDFFQSHAKFKEISHVLSSEVNEQDHQTKCPQQGVLVLRVIEVCVCKILYAITQ